MLTFTGEKLHVTYFFYVIGLWIQLLNFCFHIGENANHIVNVMNISNIVVIGEQPFRRYLNGVVVMLVNITAKACFYVAFTATFLGSGSPMPTH